MPPPPSGYKFAADDYLYAPRPDEEPAPTAGGSAPEAPSEVAAAAPKMVWSEARSTWEPAAPPAPDPPLALPPPPPFPSARPVPPPPWPSSKPPRRRSKGRWVAGTMVTMFLITRMVAGLHGALSDEGSPPTVAVPFPAYTGVPQAPAPVPSPTVPIPAKPPAVLTSVADLLGTQIAGVRAGNESWFLGTIDPQARAAVATYKRLFANLHTLRASDFTESSGAVGDSIRAKTWIRVNVAFCIDGTTTGCTLASADLDVQVGPRGKGVAIEAVNPVADLGRVAVPPWLATSLTASLAGNVLLVGTPATKARIVDMVKAAEVAGALADQYAPIGVPPRPYVVYLATHADVAAWFGGPGQISHGVVDPSIGDDQAVLALPEATTKGPKGGDGLAADMQRALGKLSLTHGDDTPFLVDTLSLGIQEHAAYDGLPGADADTLAPLAGFVHSGAWDGSCYYTYDSQAGLDAMPGIGLLAIRYLVKYYGIDAVMNFWTKVERQRESVQNASIEEFNMAWSDVNGDCAAYVLDTADNP